MKDISIQLVKNQGNLYAQLQAKVQLVNHILNIIYDIRLLTLVCVSFVDNSFGQAMSRHACPKQNVGTFLCVS